LQEASVLKPNQSHINDSVNRRALPATAAQIKKKFPLPNRSPAMLGDSWAEDFALCFMVYGVLFCLFVVYMEVIHRWDERKKE
jgi:hypothetical protein